MIGCHHQKPNRKWITALQENDDKLGKMLKDPVSSIGHKIKGDYYCMLRVYCQPTRKNQAYHQKIREKIFGLSGKQIRLWLVNNSHHIIRNKCNKFCWRPMCHHFFFVASLITLQHSLGTLLYNIQREFKVGQCYQNRCQMAEGKTISVQFVFHRYFFFVALAQLGA